MGATTAGLTMMLSREFTRLVIIAFVPAAVAAWFVVDGWLNGFAYRVEVSPLIFVGSGAMATAIAWFTVSFQSIKAASSNPVNSLRYE
jgi:putative ABC transport system permease protein